MGCTVRTESVSGEMHTRGQAQEGYPCGDHAPSYLTMAFPAVRYQLPCLY